MSDIVKSAELHPKESERLAKLLRYEVMDSEDEAAFDELTELASSICETPISLISLVDDKRQWFKSKVGLNAQETPKSIAFCSHAILDEVVFEVPDALADERFHDNPLVAGAPDIRFYAGAPLVTDEGLPIGTLCVIDRHPKTLSDSQRRALTILSNQVVKQLELRLHNRRLERIGENRERMFAMLAHDLRTPFNAILGLSRQLVKRGSTFSVEDVVGKTQNVLDASVTAYQLLDEMLQWSQSMMGAVVCEPKVCDVKALMLDAIDILKDPMSFKRITLKCDIPPGLNVFADALIVKTVVRNLVANAMKYSPDGESITISAVCSGDVVTIGVADNGCGLPEEVKRHLFNDKLDSSLGTAGEKGVGVGLMLCQSLLAVQSSTIRLAPTDAGAKFIFSLPSGSSAS